MFPREEVVPLLSASVRRFPQFLAAFALFLAALILGFPWAVDAGWADAPLLPEAHAAPSVMVLVMENLGYRQAVAIPALAELMRQNAYATEAYAVAHPSLPNYLALTSGSTFGITSDCWFCYVRASNLAAELEAAHIPYALYLEGLPRVGWLGPYWPFTGYAGKHNPWRYYVDVRSSKAMASHLEPLSTLMRLLRGPASRLPRFMWVTPNLCHDGHDCPAAEAALWLRSFVAAVKASAWWREGGVLVVTWDEGAGGDTRGVDARDRIVSTGGGGHILSLVVARSLPPGTHVAVPLNHYSLLKFVEEVFHLPYLRMAGDRHLPSYDVFWKAAKR